MDRTSERWKQWYEIPERRWFDELYVRLDRERAMADDERRAFDKAPFKIWANGKDVSIHQNIEDARAAAFKLDRELQGTITVIGIEERDEDGSFHEWYDEDGNDIENIIESWKAEG